ncbi:MAG: hypothetical protein JJE28_06820 [Actinomycetales bacterium]|nr:hypothetical protein [Actinomycetales bacterium]
MKSSLITVLIIVGVFGTATVAMAINVDTLSVGGRGTIGKAIEVLVPVVSESERLTPVSPTDSPSAGDSQTPPGNVAPAPSVQAPVAPAVPVTTESGGSSSTSPTSGSFDDSSSGHEDNETEDDD